MGEYTDCAFCVTYGDGLSCAHSLQRTHMPGGIPLVRQSCDGCLINSKPSGVARRPPIVTRAKNLVASMYNHAVSGGGVVSKEIADKRYEICKLCEPYFDNGICNHAKCGCFLSVKVKLPTSTCPISKWGDSAVPQADVDTINGCV